jgi:hypothetical protein
MVIGHSELFYCSAIVGSMKYVMLICDDESRPITMEQIATSPEFQAYENALNERDSGWVGARLRPVANATTVRVRDGETLVSDGPFAETKDFIGGITIVECDNLDEAIAIAATHPYATWGSVEIRPVWE